MFVGCLALLSFGQSHAASASEDKNLVQELPEIQNAVRDFIVSQHDSNTDVDVEVKTMDKRLRLAACSEPLDAFWSPGSRSMGRVTVQVECAAPKPWRVHVQSTVTLEGLVWTLDRGVARGELLTRDLLKQVTVKIGSHSAAGSASAVPIVNIEPWLGFAFSQRVRAGKVLGERMLKLPMLVSKGEAVLIVHESFGLQLQTKGVALTNAALGKRVQVRNTSSGKIVEATAVARGLVEVLN